MTDYKPISCIDYSHLEVAILHKSALRVAWHDSSEQDHIETVTPIDLQTRKGAEYLHCISANKNDLEIRLDKIIRFNTIDPT